MNYHQKAIRALTEIRSKDATERISILERIVAEIATRKPSVLVKAAENLEIAPEYRFDVFLIEEGETRIRVISEMCSVFGFGLREAKALVDSTPCIVAKNVSAPKAINIKKRLSGAGAVVDIEKRAVGKERNVSL